MFGYIGSCLDIVTVGKTIYESIVWRYVARFQTYFKIHCEPVPNGHLYIFVYIQVVWFPQQPVPESLNRAIRNRRHGDGRGKFRVSDGHHDEIAEPKTCALAGEWTSEKSEVYTDHG